LTAPTLEDQMRRLIYELQLMETSAGTLQQRLSILQNAVAELRVAEMSLRGVEEAEEGSPILVPMGGGTFVKAELGELSKVVVNIGADVSIDMTLEEAKENVSGRLEEAEKANEAVGQQLNQILAQMQSHQDNLNRLNASLRGEPPSV